MSERATLSAAKLALAIRRMRADLPDAQMLYREPIAVIGMGCRFPGGVRSLEDYWNLLRNGVDAISEIPPDRWSAADFLHSDPQQPGKMNSRWGGFVDGPDLFDPVLFGIAPREAASMDPQQRLLLEVTWESLWDGGIAPDKLAGSQTGVFVAIYNSDYARLLLDDCNSIGPHTCAGASNSVASGRLSYLLDLHGPSVSVDTACSSSLVAIHIACQSLRTGECRMALAGGVTLHLTPEHLISVAKLGMLAPDGRCKAFDARANGFVPGEGCGIVVLKRLSDALADGDRIWAVIRGSAVNQDGRTSVLTAPNGLAQRQVVRAALENAGVPAAAIGYVETHGTGTALGDPIEVEALAEVLSEAASDAAPCVLGAVKTNFGHLEAAAGVAGLIKTALVLHHGEVPRNLHFESLNPHIALEGTRLRVAAETCAWPRSEKSRFAGVSSFGFGGTNVHVVLEEAPRMPRAADSPENVSGVPMLFVASARSGDALRQFALRYRDFLEPQAEGAHTPLYALCHSAALRRSHYEDRLAITAESHEELRARLEDFAGGRSNANACSGRAAYERGGVLLVCSGQGSQWPGMGMRLLAREPEFRAALEECDRLIQRRAGWSLLEQLRAGESESQLHRTAIAQPALVSLEVALARLWRSWGIVPAAVVGHSVGEIAAAHIAGVLELEEALRIAIERGRLMELASGLGSMAAVRLPSGRVSSEIQEFGGVVSVAAVNGPVSTVVAGTRPAIDLLLSRWRERGVGCRALGVNYAFHSAQMDPFRRELVELLGRVETRKAAIPIFSTVTGQRAAGEEFDAAHWGANVREPVLFGAAVEQALAMGLDTVIEAGPHPVLAPAVTEILEKAHRNARVIASLRRGSDDHAVLMRSLGALYVDGHAVNWNAVYSKPAPPANLPPYPYQKRRYWVAPRRPDEKVEARRNHLHPLVGRRLSSPTLAGVVFESHISLESLPYLADHTIDGTLLLPMTAWIEMVLAATAAEGSCAREIADLAIAEPLILSQGQERVVQIVIDGQAFRGFSLEGDSWKQHISGRTHTLSAAAPASVVCAAPFGCGVQPEEHYRRLKEMGLAFGPAFQGIVELSVRPGEALARVTLGDSQETAGYRFHPALLDACMQTVLAAAPQSGEGCWIPFGLDCFRAYAPLGSTAQAHARLLPCSEANTSVLSADLDVCDANGALLAEIRGLHLKQRHPEAASRRNSYLIRWEAAAPQGSRYIAGTAGRWLIAGDAPDAAERLATMLRQFGAGVSMHHDGAQLELPEGLTGIVFLAGLDSTATPTLSGLQHARTAGCGALLEIVQALARRAAATPVRLCVVTRDAMPVLPFSQCSGIASAPVWGLARTIAAEHPEVDCVCVDLDPDSEDVERLADSILVPAGEPEIAFRAGERYVPRIERLAPGEPSPRRLTISARGSIENLAVEPLARRAPRSGELEVRVQTSALNFRDVLNVLGMYPGDPGPLGLEFCGRVTRVGEDVTGYVAGDLVTGIAWGSFADYVTTPAAFVITVPEGLDAESAVTLPNAFLTAYHCLVHVAGMGAGDRVLIHAATGGVGLAAVQLAQRAGAEVFATAGSSEKRQYLRSLGVRHVMNSRTPEFAHEVLERTGGRGLDIVLNSLAGEMIAAGFTALARGGRFIEIGKTGIGEGERLAVSKHVRYSVVDLALVLENAPELIRSHLSEIVRGVQDGSLRPLPKEPYAFDAAAAAFRHMAQAKHIGKVVLRQAPEGMRVSADASYLVIGGMGGLGVEMAAWLVKRGARNLVLVGRSQPSEAAAARLDELRRAGTRIEIRAADVAKRAELEAVLREASATLPPLRGVIHAAGVLDDGPLAQQTLGRFERVMAPKIEGAWNLHELTKHESLDFFVMFSSLASILGSPGQGSYAAANRFLDALAHYRRALGLAALSVNWGAWAGAGMAAKLEAQGRRRALTGIRPMNPQQCLAALANVAELGTAQALIADVDWTEWRPTPRLLSPVVPAPTEAQAAPQESGILERLEQAPPGNRRSTLIAYLREQAARILGLGASHFIDERLPLMTLGLDSLMALEFRNQLAEGLRRPLSTTLLFDHPTLAALADHLLPVEESCAAANERDAVLETVSALSDAEAERLLGRELGTSS